MSQVGGAGIEGSLGAFVVRIGVRHRDGAQLACLPDEVCPTGQLRRNVCNGDQAATALIKLLKCRKIRFLQVRAVLRPFFLFGKIRRLLNVQKLRRPAADAVGA
jgi:hypothetical protein